MAMGSAHPDTDHDGVADLIEMNTTFTHPVRARDADDDGLPDDWERNYHRTHSPTNEDPLALHADTVIDPQATPPVTLYQEFKEDWVIGLNLEFGGQLFWHNGIDYSAPRSHSFVGDQSSRLRIAFADADHSRISSITVYPMTNYGETDPIVLAAEPSATYTWVEDPDPTRSGYVFSASPGHHVVRDAQSNLPLSVGALDGRPAPLDLLRNLDTMAWPADAPRPRGDTEPMPLRRALLDGSTPRRIPAPLAITSLPVTEIGPDHFPFTLREASNYLYHSDVDFFEDHTVEPGDRMVRRDWLPNPIHRELDADGLPQGVATPEYYDTGGDQLIRSPLTFARWYRDKSARSFVLPGISAPVTPPDQEFTFGYGFYNSTAEGFYPHRNEVNERDKFTTEVHCRLDYTPDTQLFIESNDDCWVFINGKLVDALDLGGIPPTDEIGYTSKIAPSSILNELNITETSGSCRLDIFHADRLGNVTYSPGNYPSAQLRLLSTTALKPIYCYQVIAESSTQQPITYAFGKDPVTQLSLAPAGMTIDPTSGKIIWDLYASTPPSAGTYPVVVKISDPLGNTDTQAFDLIVHD